MLCGVLQWLPWRSSQQCGIPWHPVHTSRRTGRGPCRSTGSYGLKITWPEDTGSGHRPEIKKKNS